MANDNTMTVSRQSRFVKHLEAQGATVKKVKKGFMVVAPDGQTATLHFSSSDWRASRNNISTLRRMGLHHPDDKRESPKMTDDKPQEPEYPKYMTQAITSTTRKQILAALEERGWPVRVMARELPIESSVASRALYNVGYRYDPEFGKTTRNQVWAAPPDIIELHEKSKAEMKRREQQALERRRAMHALAAVPEPVHTTETEPTGRSIPTPRDVARAIVEAANAPAPPTEVTEQEVSSTEHAAGAVESKREPEREFIDSVDSWTVDVTALPSAMFGAPLTVEQLLMSLRASGLEVEIRVWRKGTA